VGVRVSLNKLFGAREANDPNIFRFIYLIRMGVAGLPWVLCFFSMQRAERALHIEMGAGNDDAASAADAGKKHFLSARPISPQFG
jgi:hypothetical protein